MPAPNKKPFQDYYLLFGLPPTASQSEIKTAYRELALKLHPDQNPSPEAHNQFLLLNEAYHILNNPKERSKYDLRYKHYYNPHKKSAGLSERIELTRAKRASRYGRSMYSQRMRYRGSTGPINHRKSRERTKSYTPPSGSGYNWDIPEVSESEVRQKKYATIIQAVVSLLLILHVYSFLDYVIRVPSDKLNVIETINYDQDQIKVVARKYYYQNYTFYARPSYASYFTPDAQVRLIRSYFQGRLFEVRVFKGDRIYVVPATRNFYDLDSIS